MLWTQDGACLADVKSSGWIFVVKKWSGTQSLSLILTIWWWITESCNTPMSQSVSEGQTGKKAHIRLFFIAESLFLILLYFSMHSLFIHAIIYSSHRGGCLSRDAYFILFIITLPILASLHWLLVKSKNPSPRTHSTEWSDHHILKSSILIEHIELSSGLLRPWR